MGCLHPQPFNSRMSPKGDSEYFSVNCSVCVSLAASSPSLASAEIPGPTETRTSLSATAPRANAAGKSRITALGKRTAPGQLGEARIGEGWRKGEGAQTHRGCRDWLLPARAAEAQTPPSSLSQPPCLSSPLSLKRRLEAGLQWALSVPPLIFPDLDPPPESGHPSLHHRIS